MFAPQRCSPSSTTEAQITLEPVPMMRLALRLQNLKSRVFLFIATLVFVGVVAMTAYAWLTPSAEPSLVPMANAQLQPVPPTQPMSASTLQLEIERITILHNGFDPEEITRPAGEVMLAIDNRSGLEEVRLRVDREGGQRLVDVSVNRKKLDWRKKIDLPPGRYRLTEANHPEWLCRITITP